MTVAATGGATPGKTAAGTNGALAGAGATAAGSAAGAGARTAGAAAVAAAAPEAGHAAAAGMRAMPMAGGAAATSGEDAGVAEATNAGGDGTIPCGPWKALANACHSCHGEVPTNGAPMSLVTQGDFQILSVQKVKIPKYELARMRIDGSRRPIMPPGGAIAETDKQTLLDWLDRKAPVASADEPSCK